MRPTQVAVEFRNWYQTTIDNNLQKFACIAFASLMSFWSSEISPSKLPWLPSSQTNHTYHPPLTGRINPGYLYHRYKVLNSAHRLVYQVQITSKICIIIFKKVQVRFWNLQLSPELTK